MATVDGLEDSHGTGGASVEAGVHVVRMARGAVLEEVLAALDGPLVVQVRGRLARRHVDVQPVQLVAPDQFQHLIHEK